MAKKLTPMQKAFKQQLARIFRIERSLMSEGAFLSKRFSKVEMPKRVTKKAIEQLKEIKPITIRKQAQIEYNDEIWEYQQYYKEKRKAKREKKKETKKEYATEDDMINLYIDNFAYTIDQIHAKGVRNACHQLLLSLIIEHGKRAVAISLKNMPISAAEIWASTGYDYAATLEQIDAIITQNLPNEVDGEDIVDAFEMANTSWDEI